jgi:hypothetical protein
MRRTRCRRIAGCAAVLVMTCGSALAQQFRLTVRERMPEERPTLLVLGAAHLNNPGRDLINLQVDDVLTEARQTQILAVVEQLTFFQPTHVAVEWPLRDQSALDARYQAYRAGQYRLSRDEVDQIGLRLAAKLGLTRIHAVDWSENAPGDRQDYDWAAYGKAHGQRAQIAAISDPKRNLGLVPLGTQSIGAWFLQLNRSDVLAAGHRNYFDWASIGDQAAQPGANWVGAWYGRNLRIFNNLVRLTARPDDRILAIYGAGHAYLLRQFAVESGAFRLVDVSAVLSEK